MFTVESERSFRALGHGVTGWSVKHSQIVKEAVSKHNRRILYNSDVYHSHQKKSMFFMISTIRSSAKKASIIRVAEKAVWRSSSEKMQPCRIFLCSPTRRYSKEQPKTVTVLRFRSVCSKLTLLCPTLID